jgi:hypothetical protein
LFEIAVTFDRKAVRPWHRQIIDVLNREWDPIGVVSDNIEDEYDSYAAKIAALIRNGATDDQLSRYLEKQEIDSMGLSRPFDKERATKVIAELRKLGPPP